MAEAIMVVCDDCGEPAEHTLTLKIQGTTSTRQKDVCQQHTDAIMHGARAATRGRPRNKANGVKSGTRRPRKAAARKRRTAAKK